MIKRLLSKVKLINFFSTFSSNIISDNLVYKPGIVYSYSIYKYINSEVAINFIIDIFRFC